MSFIRLKKRVSKSNENYYAYLVDNKWDNYSPKQKVRAYLGKYIKLEQQNKVSVKLNKRNLFKDLVKQELLSHNFVQKNKSLFIHAQGYLVDFNKKRVLNADKTPVCLGINQGYLCNYTLNKLFSLKYKINKKKDKELLRALLDIGITPNKDLFSEVFRKIS